MTIKDQNTGSYFMLSISLPNFYGLDSELNPKHIEEYQITSCLKIDFLNLLEQAKKSESYKLIAELILCEAYSIIY